MELYTGILRFFLILLGLSGTVFAGPSSTQVCDVYVNDIRITWPEGWLSYPRCESLMLELIAKDNTEAVIECRCQVGDQS